MKKTVALLLALVMALSAAFALAEPTEEAEPSGLILSSSVSVDRGVAEQIMDALNTKEAKRPVADAAIAVLNTVNDRLTIAENGIEYRFAMNDVELLTVTGGFTDEGFVFMSSLLPNYALTLSANALETIAQLRGLAQEIRDKLRKSQSKQSKQSAALEEALEVLMPYIEGFVEQAAAAVQPGAPEKGAFEFEDGVSYNTRQPIGLDAQAIVDALNDTISKIVEDEKAVAALDKLGVVVKSLENLTVVTERLPVFDLAVYSTPDDSGAEISSDRCFSAAITLPEQDAPAATFDLQMWEKSIDAMLKIPGSDIAVTFTFAPFDAETAAGGIALAVDKKDRYFAASGVITPNQDGSALTLNNSIYILDDAKPLAAATTAIEPSDAPLDLSVGDREVVPLGSLFGKGGKKLRGKLRRSIVFSGLSIISTATEAVPELADLLSLMSGEDAEDAA